MRTLTIVWLILFFMIMAAYYQPCEQMCYYSIQATTTEPVRRNMIEELLDFVYLPFIDR